jgi:hypothetical protein
VKIRSHAAGQRSALKADGPAPEERRLLWKLTGLWHRCPVALKGAIQVAAILLGCLWLTQHIWAENLAADWGMVDDHEIQAYLGPDQRITAGEAWGFFITSEAGAPGKAPRYRPAYFALRLSEMWLWGASAHSWYLARMVMSGALIAAAWAAMARFAGIWLAGAWALSLMQPRYWSDIFARLGPAETYASVGVALSALGCAWLWKPPDTLGRRADRVSRHAAWIMAGMGAVVAIGAKENFVFVPGLLALVALRESGRRRMVWTGVAITTMTIALAGLIVYSVLASVSAAGVDIYGHQVAGASVPTAVWVALKRFGIRWLGPAVCIVMPLAFTLLGRYFPPLKSWAQRFTALAAIELGLSALIVMQVFFYRGHWESGSRYAFPGETLFMLLWVAPVVFLVHVAVPGVTERPILRAAAIVVACILFTQPVIGKGYQVNQRACLRNRILTQQYMETTQALVKEATADPQAVVAVRAREVGEIEGAVAVARALRFFGVTNPVVAVNEGKLARGGWSETGEQLLLKMWERLWNGQWEGFSPQGALQDAETCLEVSPSHMPVTSIGCKSFGVLWREPGNLL